jgi:hypothetical protein
MYQINNLDCYKIEINTIELIKHKFVNEFHIILSF